MTQRIQKTRAGRPRLDQVGERLDALLAGAETVFLECGYEAATIGAIAQAAGVSTQTIYAKFGSKHELLRAVLQRISDKVLTVSLDAEDGLGLYEGLLLRARTLLQINTTKTSLAITTISIRESQRFPEFREAMLEAKRLRQQEPLQRYFERLQRLGAIRPIDCEQTASMFLWLVAENMVDAAATGRTPVMTEEGIEQKAAFIARLIADGISPSKA